MDWTSIFSLSAIWAGFLFTVDWAIRIASVFFVPAGRKPSAGMAWLLLIFALPIPGLLLFLLIGNPKLPKKRRDVQTEINEVLRTANDDLELGTLLPNPPEWFAPITRMNRELGALPLSGDNGARIISGYQESIDAMEEAIRGAERYVHLEFYILKADAATEGVFEALEDACRRGVHVRVLMDHWANLAKPLHKQTKARLDAMGADWHLLLPLKPLQGKFQRPDLRNHRKLLVVDGEVAFLGSQNLIDPSYNVPKNIKRGLKWVDVMVRLDGPVVRSVDAVFMTDYYSETGRVPDGVDLAEQIPGTDDFDCQIIPSGPGFEAENNLHMFLSLIYAAKKRVVMVSPYFVPDEALIRAVDGAVTRGVKVELFVSEIGDQAVVYHAQRSYYDALLRAGVRIWMYPGPYILHTKSLTIDDEVAVIGSSNMDMRSFGLNFEVSLLVRGDEFVERVREVEDAYRDVSRELTLEEWVKQPRRSRTLDNLARLTSALQ
ncbi:cardiolipin synthase [Microbacterium amylolyticum]|uniref:Cardiolipin synthase n=1 Tax=Microbacterium amylolyticum TaxID=936337 RepID=A0ABS4ZHB4_9MICO|nr:cardiolipin synthase [Microbacterium amylolyticum]MBP2436380.1 cardiolipin synthase [Microbacterium amylolyticum]